MKRIMCKSFYIVAILLFYQIQSITAYQNTEKTLDDSYKFLLNKFYENEVDSVIAVGYANKYLSKAKKEKDTLRIADGYYFLSSISTGETSIKYCDTIIAITKNHQTESYPTYAYLNKALKYFDMGNFKKAFDYYLKVYDETEKYNNIFLQYSCKKNIGILKAILGENETALVTLRECYAFYSKYKEKAPNDYLTTLFALSESYNFNKVLDSASMINRIGYKESIELKAEQFTCYFVLNEGINQFSKSNYTVAKDSLAKAIKDLELNGDKTNLGQAHFYLGKTLSSLDFEEEAIEEHKKADKIFQEVTQIIPENRENHEILISYYKSINDTDSQLEYIEKLLRVDSILNSNYKYLIKNVVQNYDTPRLLSEKQKIIDSLKGDKKSSTIIIIFLVILSMMSSVFLVFNYRKKKRYKQRFDELYNSSSANKKNQKTLSTTSVDSIGISEDIANKILNDLDEFERKQDFLKPSITTNELAKKMNTNSKYLSRVINHYKKKSFIVYINELRIDYCIEKLKTDKKFMNYTIKAIAREIGFNSTDAFSKSFYKIKKIQPSYFIRELEKQQRN
ncbi:AraC family transcriptional regulator [Aquimarina sp. AU119]|uniref:AraC family transcriptional regulator n=1 Tax=Aquimarina sp. AU119 TaxID=2108528 RepID=UPI00135C305C|nr:AraC family transcriptional regulator [Aquimarina sp. AU119]